MNQPKFKIGDMVKCGPEIFQVHWINLGFKGYEYMTEIKEMDFGERQFNVFPEEKVELYQEPKKKKLYAYIMAENKDCPIEFYHEEMMPGYGIGLKKRRVPEYDIEYPCEAPHTTD